MNAVACFFMAAEYNYPNVIEYAQQAYSELNVDEQAKARELAGQYKKAYGLAQLQTVLLPSIFDEPIEDQKIKKPLS